MSRNEPPAPVGLRHKWWIIAGVVVLIGAVVVAYIVWPVNEIDTAQVTVSPALAPPRPHTIPNDLEDGVKADLAAAGFQAVTFASVRIDDGAPYDFPAGSKVIYLRLDVNDRMLGLLEQANVQGSKFFRRAFAVSPDVSGVFIDFIGPVADRYGHRYAAPWISFVMDRATYAKIDWNGFDGGNLCEFLSHEHVFNSQSKTFCGTKGEL